MLSARSEQDDRDRSLSPGLILREVGIQVDQLWPEVVTFLRRSDPRRHGNVAAALEMDLHLGVSKQVEVPLRVLWQTSLRGDDDQVLAVGAQVQQRSGVH